MTEFWATFKMSSHRVLSIKPKPPQNRTSNLCKCHETQSSWS